MTDENGTFEYWYKAKCVGLYDGDTITCDIDVGFEVILRQQKIRLFGIDTPELRGEEREAGIAAKMFVMDRILGEDIVLRTYKDKTGKYGRWLATVYYFDEKGQRINLNAELVMKGYAEEY